MRDIQKLSKYHSGSNQGFALHFILLRPDFINTAGVRRMICGVKFVKDKLRYSIEYEMKRKWGGEKQ